MDRCDQVGGLGAGQVSLTGEVGDPCVPFHVHVFPMKRHTCPLNTKDKEIAHSTAIQRNPPGRAGTCYKHLAAMGRPEWGFLLTNSHREPEGEKAGSDLSGERKEASARVTTGL